MIALNGKRTFTVILVGFFGLLLCCAIFWENESLPRNEVAGTTQEPVYETFENIQFDRISMQPRAAPGTVLGSLGHDPSWLFYPEAIAVNSSGYVFIAEQSQSQDFGSIVVFGPSPTYAYQYSITLDDAPSALAVNGSDYLYVGEYNNGHIRRYAPDGSYLGSFGGYGVGDGQFLRPNGIAFNTSGHLIVTDADTIGNNDRIQAFTPVGGFVHKWGSGLFGEPSGIAVNSTDYVYVTDSDYSVIQIFDSDGILVMQFGSEGTNPEEFYHPNSIVINGSDFVYVGDGGNARLQIFNASCEFNRTFGTSGSSEDLKIYEGQLVFLIDRTNARWRIFSPNDQDLFTYGSIDVPAGILKQPWDVAVNASGYIYVTDNSLNRIQIFSPTGKFIHGWGSYGTGDYQFTSLMGISINGTGHVFAIDNTNNWLKVYDCWGNFIDKIGGPVAGIFLRPRDVAINSTGYIYVTDQMNHQVDVFTPELLEFYSWGVMGIGDGQLQMPSVIDINSSGSVYIVDGQSRYQAFTPSGGFISKTNGLFEGASGITFDSSGNTLVVKESSAEPALLVIDLYGTLKEVIGSLGSGLGQFRTPRGIDLNGSRVVFIADSQNHRVQYFQLWDANVKPSISDTLGVTYYYCHTGNSIQWTIFDDNVTNPTYNLLLDRSPLQTGLSWTPGTPIKLSVDGLSVGTHTYTIVAYDGWGLSSTVDIKVIVNELGATLDSDQDGMPDIWECTYGLNLADPSDAAGDLDGDLLTNLGEYQNQTDPKNSDTDGDSFSDGEEVAEGSDPLDPNDYPSGDGGSNNVAFVAGAVGTVSAVGAVVVANYVGAAGTSPGGGRSPASGLGPSTSPSTTAGATTISGQFLHSSTTDFVGEILNAWHKIPTKLLNQIRKRVQDYSKFKNEVERRHFLKFFEVSDGILGAEEFISAGNHQGAFDSLNTLKKLAQNEKLTQLLDEIEDISRRLQQLKQGGMAQ